MMRVTVILYCRRIWRSACVAHAFDGFLNTQTEMLPDEDRNPLCHGRRTELSGGGRRARGNPLRNWLGPNDGPDPRDYHLHSDHGQDEPHQARNDFDRVVAKETDERVAGNKGNPS